MSNFSETLETIAADAVVSYNAEPALLSHVGAFVAEGVRVAFSVTRYDGELLVVADTSAINGELWQAWLAL